MLILGLLLIAAGALAILAAVTTASGTVELLGTDLGALTIFLVGVGAGVAVLWGYSITKFGTRRSLQRRRESRRLSERSQQLERAETERREGGETTRSDRDDRP